MLARAGKTASKTDKTVKNKMVGKTHEPRSESSSRGEGSSDGVPL